MLFSYNFEFIFCISLEKINFLFHRSSYDFFKLIKNITTSQKEIQNRTIITVCLEIY